MNDSDDYFVASDLDPINGYQESHIRYHPRLAFIRKGGEWEIAIIGKNLTDVSVCVSSNDVPLADGNGFAQRARLKSVAA